MIIEEVNRCLPPMLQLSSEQYELIDQYLDELLVWNRKINLTAIRKKNICWQKHIIDSLMLGEFIDPDSCLLDIGSGAGLPSIPLKIFYPQLSVTSVDTVSKKIQFQKHCVRKLHLTHYQALSTRIEHLNGQSQQRYPYITSRAFSSLAQFCQLSHHYLADNGVLIAMKGADYKREIEEATDILSELDLEIVTIHERILQPLDEKRAFIVLNKGKQVAVC